MKKILFITIMSLLAVVAFGQEEEKALKPETTMAVSFMPQYLIVGGMRMDFDMQVAPKGWLTLAPVFYYVDNTYMWDPETTSYTGVGAVVNYRYFPSGKGIYASVGANYRYLNAEYTKYNVSTINEAKFNTLGFDLAIGYQFLLVDQFFMDLYLGWGFRYSMEDSDEEDSYWSDALLDLGYSGFLPVAGVRLGFEF